MASAGVNDGWAIYASEVTGDPALILDARRHCQNYARLSLPLRAWYYRLGDVLVYVSSKFKKHGHKVYRYVEIEEIHEHFGAYDWSELRGWSLRAVQDIWRNLEIFSLQKFGRV